MAVIFNPFTGNLDLTGGGVAGSDTQVQFNDNGAFGGDADLTWNKTSNTLTVAGDVNLNDGGSFTTTLQTITPTANRTISFPNATGTVALVAGSSGQLTYNLNGAQSGLTSLLVGSTGDLNITLNGAASTPPLDLTGTWFTGGTTTTTKPQFLIEPAGTTSTGWSTSGTGLGVNAASGFAGNLLDLQVNGTRVGSINSSGTFTLVGGGFTSTATANFGNWSFSGIVVAPQCQFTNIRVGSTGDVYIERDAAGTLAQRNGTNAQTFRVYNTFTDASNYERGKLEWASNTFRIGTQSAGTGVARPMSLRTNNADRLVVDTIGSLQVATALTVATLPGTPAVGMIARVTDATTPVVGSTVTGGGAAAALVWYNGTAWTVLGV